MKKLSGYDLNGWRDLAARNWVLQSDGEENEVPSAVIEGGLLGVVVQTGDGPRSTLIGGAQGTISPHGLGEGWGAIGKSGRRTRIRDFLSGNEVSVEQLTAALVGLSSAASFGVASLDDIPGSSEVLQERMLAALRKAKISTPLLVWRSVLAALYAIESGDIASGQSLGVICHSATGLCVQRLKIRLERDQARDVLAPERKAAGRLLPSEWGYEGLAIRAKQAVFSCASTDRTEHLEWARSIGRLMLGMAPGPEVLRMRNGDWEVITPPTLLELAGLELPEGLAAELLGCDTVLVESLAEGEVRSKLHEQIRELVSAPVTMLPPDAIADGALWAARRLSKREPIYFDFLPQISTIVQRRDGAENYDLIDSEATLSAGEVYRSPKPARFAIQAGQETFSIFLNKETSGRPRKAQVFIGVKSKEPVPVDLWVEQSPAAGRAKILLHSESSGHRFQVDWDGAEELEESWEDVLASLQRGTPTIPARLVLPCGPGAWNDSNRGDGLYKLLEKNVDRDEVDWAAIASKLSARPDGQYAISSDGEIPGSITETGRANLLHVTERAVEHVQSRLASRLVANNDSLRFLTWQFRRCPPEVTGWLLDALDQEIRGHRLFTLGAHWKLCYQGLGRIAATRTSEQQAIHKILGKTIDLWSWQRETAAMAFMLSRSETAPRLLTRKDVERVAKRALREFDENLKSTYTRFQYAPLLLVGLLRWRLVEPFALVAGQDPVADKLAQSVEKTLSDLRHPSRVRALAKYGRILEQTLDELRGEGTNPDLLLDIFGGADGSDG
ncbi:hypothetical protein GR216_19465 [Rhizobium leguminosarum]|nr:hypothetical protein [Rhizobium ruizarguesonis]NEJ37654.1 hypothetical protein [Rhizobium ruizarguesonis]